MKRPALIILVILCLIACKHSDDPAPDTSFTGTLKSSGIANFSGICTWGVEYVNSTFKITLDNKNQKALSATVSTEMIETVISGTCTNPYPRNIHNYSLKSYAIDGKNIFITFKQDADSFPQNESSFTGVINRSNITGTLTLYRKSNAIFCKVEMPFEIQKLSH